MIYYGVDWTKITDQAKAVELFQGYQSAKKPKMYHMKEYRLALEVSDKESVTNA